MELVKGVSSGVAITGVIFIIIGFILTKYKPSAKIVAYVLYFIGFILIIFWIANRKDQLCPTDINDNSPCVPVKK